MHNESIAEFRSKFNSELPLNKDSSPEALAAAKETFMGKYDDVKDQPEWEQFTYEIHPGKPIDARGNAEFGIAVDGAIPMPSFFDPAIKGRGELLGTVIRVAKPAQPNKVHEAVPSEMTWQGIIAMQAMTKEDWKKVEDMKFYIDRFAHETGLLMLSAKPGAAKSWLAYMIANRIMEQHQDVKTLFIDQDSGAGYNKKRANILKQRHGDDRFDYISQVKTDLDGTYKILTLLAKTDLHRKIIILDSLMALMRKGSVKNDDDVREIMDACEALRNAGALVILITHDKKAKDENGKGVFAGSVRIEKTVDAYFAVAKNGDMIECTCAKLRGAEKASRNFKIESFEGMIATDEDYASVEEQKVAGKQQANDINDEKIFNMISNAEHMTGQPLTQTTLKDKARESNPSISTRQTGYSINRLIAAKRIFEESIGSNNSRLLRTTGQTVPETKQ